MLPSPSPYASGGGKPSVNGLRKHGDGFLKSRELKKNFFRGVFIIILLYPFIVESNRFIGLRISIYNEIFLIFVL